MEQPQQQDWQNKLERYKILVAQAHYDGQHRFWTVGWFLTAHTIFLGSLLHGVLTLDHPSVVFYASVAGFVFCAPWLSMLERLSTYYNFRIAQARAVEPDGWDCFGGKAAQLAYGHSVAVNSKRHQMRWMARLHERWAVRIMIGIFAALYIILGVVSFPWKLRGIIEAIMTIDNQTWSVIGIIAQILLVFVGIIYSTVTFLMLRKLTAQVKSTSSYNLTALSNKHNWEILTFQYKEVPTQPVTIPPAVPSWRNLDAEQWKWRVLHLEHLNIIRLAWQDHQSRVLSNDEIKEWIIKAKFLFKDMRSTEPDPQLIVGREQLRQLMRRGEGYPAAFQDWLVKNKIISDDLVRDPLPPN